MAHPNEELTRRAYDAFSRGDADTLRQLFADDAVFHEPGRNPVSGDHPRHRPDSRLVRAARAAVGRDLPGALLHLPITNTGVLHQRT
jgi:ketosteroid isomerase-like protein